MNENAEDSELGEEAQRTFEIDKDAGEREPAEDTPSRSSPKTSLEIEKVQSLPRPELRRTQSRQSSMISVVRSRNPASIRPFTHKLERQQTGQDVIVDYDGDDDPYRPFNWPIKKKVLTTALYGFTTMGATFASSVYSAGVNQIAHDFHVGTEVSLLGISLLLLGFGFGPLIWAPLSECYGRKTGVILPYFVAGVFSFGSATAKDIQTLMITRYFCGFFAAGAVTNTGGVLADLFHPKTRGIALVFYAWAVVGGPTFGPIIGAALSLNETLRWRWTEYLTGIYMLFIWSLDMIFLDETYAPVLLVYKARRLRVSSNNWALHAKHEEWDVSIKELAEKYLIRPFQMLVTPICFLTALYASFVYALFYAQLAAFPVVFQELRGWNEVVGSLPFLSLLIGILIAGIPVYLNQGYYFRKMQVNNGKPVAEARLPPMMFGSILLAAGLFIFAWTSLQDVHWFPSQVGLALLGLGFFAIFQASLNYLVDTFTLYGASAIAANTFLRSVLGAALPLVMPPLLHNVGIPWGLSIFAFISVAMIPIPFLFFIFGKRIRARGYWSRQSV